MVSTTPTSGSHPAPLRDTATAHIRLAAGSGPTFGVDDLACAAATHLGFWRDEGLEVSWTPVLGGVAAMQAVLDGETDVSYGGLGPVLKSAPRGRQCVSPSPWRWGWRRLARRR